MSFDYRFKSVSDKMSKIAQIAVLAVAFNDHMVLIVDKRNGQPLLPDSSPLQIVVPQDNRPARWVRQVTTIEVKQLP